LAESTVSLQKWEEKLITQVGLSRLTLLSYLAPSLCHIVTNISKSEENAVLSPVRILELYQAVQYFLDLFATEEHPLLINLNYLNSGPGSVEMTSYLVNTPLSKRCLFLGYLNGQDESPTRSNELSPSEILEMLSYPHLENIIFAPLTMEEIQEFLSEILIPCSHSTQHLASILLRRTRGNFAFLKELIRFCEKKDLIKFDHSALSWTWDEKRIDSEVEITSNAAELMMIQFSELDLQVQYLLQCGACVGQVFDSRLVSHISNTPITLVQNFLNQAVASGYVFPLPTLYKIGSEVDSAKSASGSVINTGLMNSNSSLSQEVAQSYKFCHLLFLKRLAETLEPEEKENISLLIARYFKTNSEDKFKEKTIDMLKHYHIARVLIDNYSEILYVAELFFKFAFKSASLNTSSNYLQDAIFLLSKVLSPTPETEELMFQCQFSLVYTHIQLGLINDAEITLQVMQIHRHSAEKESKIKSLEIVILTAKRQIKEAIELLMCANCQISKLFRSFGFYSSTDHELIHRLDGLFGSKTIEDLLSKKRTEDIALSITEDMLTTCIQICHRNGETRGSSYFSLMACALSLIHGHSKVSSENFASALPYFLGRYFNYFDFKRAKFIGELVLASAETLCGEGKVNALHGLLKGYTYFCSYYEANDRMSLAVKIALEKKMAVKAFDVMLTFHTSFLLPYGKTLSIIREYDRKFKTIEFSELQGRQWDLMISAFDSIATGFPLHLEQEIEFHPQLGAFIQSANVLIGIIYRREDRFGRYKALELVEDHIHGSWL
jgi:hypothetical protein